MTRRSLPEIVPIEMATFRFADDEPLAGQEGVVIAYAIRHRDGVVMFDTGFGFGNSWLDERYHPRSRRLADALAEAGITLADIDAVVNCHLHADHAGQNTALPGIPIYVQPAEWELAHTTEHTVLEWIDFPGARYEPVAGDHAIRDGIRVVATPGHTAGHQSLVVDTPGGPTVLAGQAIYSSGEWAGEPDARGGRTSASDRDAYDLSVERLRRLAPVRVLFGHDGRGWPA